MKEIIKELSNHCTACKLNNCFREDECNGCFNNEFLQFRGKLELFDLKNELKNELTQLKEMASKQEPKQVGKKWNGNDYDVFCPKCGNGVWEMNYCQECGQKLDWSDEK